MTLAALQHCHSNALAASGRLRLPLRSRIWRGQAGEFTGDGTGSSMDFHDLRAYSPGDDPRHINWQAYARTGSYTMKTFREEVRPVVDLILDASESMFFDEKKAARSVELFYLIAESSQAAGASLALHIVRGVPHWRSIPPRCKVTSGWQPPARFPPQTPLKRLISPACHCARTRFAFSYPTYYSPPIPSRFSATSASATAALLFSPPSSKQKPAPRGREITNSSIPNAIPITRTASSPPRSVAIRPLTPITLRFGNSKPAATKPPSRASRRKRISSPPSSAKLSLLEHLSHAD